MTLFGPKAPQKLYRASPIRLMRRMLKPVISFLKRNENFGNQNGQSEPERPNRASLGVQSPIGITAPNNFSPVGRSPGGWRGGGGPEHPGRRNLVDVSWHEDAIHPAEFSRLTRRNCEFEILINLLVRSATEESWDAGRQFVGVRNWRMGMSQNAVHP